MNSGGSQQFCVRWNSHLGSLGAAFPQLLAGQRFVDVTLACEGHQLHCHRLVLAACSTYFESLLSENPCKHPIIILPHDIRLWEIQALVDFMYKGEVNVSQAGLSDLLRCAEILQIRGLCGSDAALNLNHITNQGTTGTTTLPTTTTSTTANLVNTSSNNANDNSINTSHISDGQNITQQQPPPPPLTASRTVQMHLTQQSSAIPQHIPSVTGSSASASPNSHTISGSDSESTNSNKITDRQYCTSTPNQNVHKIEPIDVTMDDGDDDSANISANESQNEESLPDKFTDYIDGAGKLPGEKRQHHQTKTEQQENNKLKRQRLQATNSSYNNNNNSVSNYNTRSSSEERSDEHSDDEDDDDDDEDDDDDDVIIVNEDETSRDKSNASNITDNSNSELSTADNSRCSEQLYGKIRVKSNENLFANYIVKKHVVKMPIAQGEHYENVIQGGSSDSNSNSTKRTIQRQTVKSGRVYEGMIPSSLKFDKQSMTIYVKTVQPTKEMPEPLARMIPLLPETSTSTTTVSANATATSKNKSTGNRQANTPENTDDESFGATIKSEYHITDSNYENIVCSPNLMEITYNDIEEDENCQDYMCNAVVIGDSYDDIKIDEDIYGGTSNQNVILPSFMDLDTVRTVSNVNERTKCLVNATYHHHRHHDVLTEKNRTACSSDNESYCNGASNNQNDCNGPTLSAVVLRNPRSNQPRTYSNDALYAALMDVKAGESIYRASQIHKVPRKTLRNWMKRWHIKSAYPMPSQLKEAAEKKKMKQNKIALGGGNSGCSTTTASNGANNNGAKNSRDK